MNSLKVFLATATLMFFGFCQPALAQVDANSLLIKSGDKASFEFIDYDQRGREVVQVGASSVTAEFEIVNGLTTIKYGNGRVDKFESDHTLLGFVSTIRSGGPVKELFRWKPIDVTPGKKAAVRTSFVSQICGTVLLDYKNVVLKEGVRKIKIQGKDTDVAVLEISFNGTWNGSCGSGKDMHEVIFSPVLGQIVELKFMNYLPNSFLFIGRGMKLVSIE